MIELLFLVGWTLSVGQVAVPQAVDDQAEHDIRLIKQLLVEQVNCWNSKDLRGFMQGYWNSDELTFSSGGRTTRGWKATLERYQKRYSPQVMGTLTFSDLEPQVLSSTVALVLGRWHLKKENNDDVHGNFTIVLRKIDGRWQIIHDHSSVQAED
jgi:ketosteroid isomerase-like protein